MLETLASPTLWAITIAGIIAIFGIDLALTRKPHEVSMREAIIQSAIYIALPVIFGIWLITAHGAERGTEFYAGYIVEKTLSVDNLFVFMLLLTAFAVPKVQQQKVLLYGIAGALVLRAIFIALGAAVLEAYSVVFLIFGLILVATGFKVGRSTMKGESHGPDPERMWVVRLGRRLGFTPFMIVVAAVLVTDVVFAVDSVPAVYGITSDPYLVFVTNAFALLGLRALYFLLSNALDGLVHLGYGLALILAFIGAKLGLHWAHMQWHSVPEIPTMASLVVIITILVTVTVTSLTIGRRESPEAELAHHS